MREHRNIKSDDHTQFYGIPEYVLTYGFLATFVAHCIFMQRWREIFRFFGIRPKRAVEAPAAIAAKAMAE